MLATSGFVKRVVGLKPLILSMRPMQLQACAERWPGLLAAASKGFASSEGPKKAGGRLNEAIREGQKQNKELTVEDVECASMSMPMSMCVHGGVHAH